MTVFQGGIGDDLGRREARRRRALASTLVVTLLVGLFSLLLPHLGALALEPDTDFESCLRSLHNSARAEAGLHKLESRSDLVSYARNHTAKMAEAGKIFHSTNLGSATSGWVKLGENVGVGGSCESLHRAFMNSSGHRANILDPQYTGIGVGGGVGPDGRYYVTVVFAAYKGGAQPTTTTTAPPQESPTTTAAPQPKPTTAPKPKPTTTTTMAPTTTTTTVSVYEAMPEVDWEALVADLIKLALSKSLPVKLP
ncbi:MAG: CAP domain-containing protein [Actinomycetes bacterium]